MVCAGAADIHTHQSPFAWLPIYVSWFSMLVLHQNRVAHSPKNYVHECMLANFLDLVLWGHEHECLITPQSSSVGDFFIVQPGASLGPSLRSCVGLDVVVIR